MNDVRIDMTEESASVLARALRQLTAEPTLGLIELLHDFGYDLGAQLGMTSASDDTDPIDEHLEPGDRIEAVIAVGEEQMADNGDWFLSTNTLHHTPPRFRFETWVGFGEAIIDGTRPDRAVVVVDIGFGDASRIARAITDGLNVTNPVLNLSHEDDG